MRLHPIVIGCGLLLTAAAPSLAQQMISPWSAIQQRQIRGIEQRAPTQPVQRDIQQQQRGLIRDQGGVNFDTQGAILDRQLDRARTRPQLAPTDPLPAVGAPDLPTTVPPGGPGSLRATPQDRSAAVAPRSSAAAFSGGRDPVTLANRLIQRGQSAVDEGRADQARSDVAAAQRLLDPFADVPRGHASFPRVDTARNRLNVLRERLAALP